MTLIDNLKSKLAMEALTLATRAGNLGLAQARIVVSALKEIYPDIQIKISRITTKGDRDRRTSLWELRDSGFFTSQIEDALLTGQADFAVHSFKDLPTNKQKGLTISAVCQREFAEDCLLTANSVSSIEQLAPSAKIGTSSLRRAVQIRRLRADLQVLPVRGNLPTRVKLLQQGRFDAIVLARAGVERLGIGGKISFCFDPAKFIPAPAQGALAVQTRTDDTVIRELTSAIDDKKTRTVTLAERQVLVTTKCGCRAPIGAFARIEGNDIVISAFISDLEGENFIRRQVAGPTEQAARLAEKLANELLKAGGKEILEKLER